MKKTLRFNATIDVLVEIPTELKEADFWDQATADWVADFETAVMNWLAYKISMRPVDPIVDGKEAIVDKTLFNMPAVGFALKTGMRVYDIQREDGDVVGDGEEKFDGPSGITTWDADPGPPF